MGVGLYIHTDFGASWLAAAKPLPSNQTEYLATFLQDLYLCITTSYRDGGWLFDSYQQTGLATMLHMLAVNSYMLIALS